jgi:LacI family transcriptional regulator
VATIADVARKAGVSVSTVSHVLNGTRRVAPGTAFAVQTAIDAFGYRPNLMARSLKAASTRSVGIASPRSPIRISATSSAPSRPNAPGSA